MCLTLPVADCGCKVEQHYELNGLYNMVQLPVLLSLLYSCVVLVKLYPRLAAESLTGREA